MLESHTWLSNRTEPLLTQVTPIWVGLSNEREISRSHPTFDLFLTSDSVAYLGERLGMNQAINFVPASESRNEPTAVLVDASRLVARDAGVKRSGPVCQNLDPIGAHSASLG